MRHVRAGTSNASECRIWESGVSASRGTPGTPELAQFRTRASVGSFKMQGERGQLARLAFAETIGRTVQNRKQRFKLIVAPRRTLARTRFAAPVKPPQVD